MEIKLSFIIPVYKVEDYLPQCLDSLLSQMTESCQLILVDDGSPDRSGELCDRYAAEHPGIRVLHKANGGPSAARNDGMALAEGKYICYVDSDDYIGEETLSIVLDWIDSHDDDVCFLQSTKVFPDGTEVPMGEGLNREAICGRSPEEVLRFLARANKFPGGPWGKLFRREFLLEHEIRFPENRLSEDLVYNVEAFFGAKSFDCLDLPFYCYRQDRAESLTNNVTEKYYFDTALFVDQMTRDYPRRDKPLDPRSECALSYAAYEYSILLWQVSLLEEAHRARAWKWLEENRWILKYALSPNPRRVKLASSVLGLRGAARLLNFYQKHRK